MPNRDDKINDLIFKQFIQRGFKHEGRSRIWDIADSKLWYLSPKQAQGFLDLEKSQDYKNEVIEKEISIIKLNINEILASFPSKNLNLIDLGCGDGKKAALIIKELRIHSFRTRYCPIDISSYMVNKAAQTIKSLKLSKVLEFTWNVSDFENLDNITPLLRDKEFNKSIILLLGNTLGNFNNPEILSNIKKSMQKNDTLVIGNGLQHASKQGMLKSYQNAHIERFLIQVIEQAGVSRSEVKYNARFRNSRVEMCYTLLKDKKITHLGKTLHLKKSDNIIIAISYKYSQEELYNALKNFFKTVKIYTDKQETYALAVCKK